MYINISKIISGVSVLACLGAFGSSQALGKTCYSHLWDKAACTSNPRCEWITLDTGYCTGPDVCRDLIRKNKDACRQKNGCKWENGPGGFCRYPDLNKNLKKSKKS